MPDWLAISLLVILAFGGLVALVVLVHALAEAGWSWIRRGQQREKRAKESVRQRERYLRDRDEHQRMTRELLAMAKLGQIPIGTSDMAEFFRQVGQNLATGMHELVFREWVNGYFAEQTRAPKEYASDLMRLNLIRPERVSGENPEHDQYFLTDLGVGVLNALRRD